MSSSSFDTFDLAILRELQRDGALSLDALAERVNLSRNACWRRVKILEETRVIRGRVALIDPERVNAGLSVLILIRTGKHAAEWSAQFKSVVAAIPEIVGAYRTSGEIDYVLKARVPNVAAYDRLYQKLIQKIDMSDVSASFVMEDIKETTEIPLSFA